MGLGLTLTLTVALALALALTLTLVLTLALALALILTPTLRAHHVVCELERQAARDPPHALGRRPAHHRVRVLEECNLGLGSA